MSEFLQFLVAGLKNGSIYALIALGFTIVYAATGAINFAQGEFFMLGGMLGVSFTELGMPLPVAAVAAIAATAAIGAVFELLAVRPIADGSPLRIIMVTIGGSVVLRQVALHVFGPDERALAPFTEGASIKAFGAAVELQTLWIWGITALAVVALSLLYRKTAFGRAMRATAIRRDAARLVGINAGMMVTVAFALAAGLGALAGVAVAPLTQTAFDVGAAIGVKGFAAAILGGIGNPIAAVGGGLLLGTARELHRRLHRPGVQGRRGARGAARSCSSWPRRVCWRAGQGQGLVNARTLRALAPLIAVAVALVVPLVISDRFLLKVFTFAGVNVLVVVGLALLFGYAGQVSLGHAAFVGLGAYTCAFCTVELGWPWLLGFVAAGAVAAFGGLLLAVPSLRLKGHYLAMATLGFGQLMSLAFVEAVPVTGGVDGFTGIPFPSIGPVEFRSASRCTGWCGASSASPSSWPTTSRRCGPGGRCAPCTAASWARRPAASTSWASRCGRSW